MKLKSVKAKQWYSLELGFYDWVYGEINLSSFLQKWIFTKLLDYDKFANVRSNETWTAIIWDDELDIDAYSCYQEIINK